MYTAQHACNNIIIMAYNVIMASEQRTVAAAALLVRGVTVIIV